MAGCAYCGSETDADRCEQCGESPLLEGRYRLEARAGAGASGTTWRATRLADGATVAIKEMLLGRVQAQKARELLGREVAVLRQLRHPQIPAYHEHLETGSGKARSIWLVIDWVAGADLAQEMADHRYTEVEVLAILAELAGVLGYLHALSPPVIHRDLKPSNVRRRPDGTLVLLDFGAVRDALKDPDLGGSTVAGTFGFMAPEQFMGEATPQTDLYGLGALGVALLTRKEPSALLQPDRTLAWADEVSLSQGALEVFASLLAAEPARRPPTAADLSAWIDRVLSAPSERPALRRPTASKAQEPPRVTLADRPPGHEPEPFHQPPMRSEPAVAAAGVLVGGGAAMAAVLLLLLAGLGVALVFASAPAPLPPVAQPRAVQRALPIYDGAQLGWPVLTPKQYARGGAACEVQTRSGPVSVGADCPEPFEDLLLTTELPAGLFSQATRVVWDSADMPPEHLLVTAQRSLLIGEPPAVEPPLRLHTEVAPIHRVMPSYPEAAREVRIANLRCEATIGFGADGVPYAIDVMACPAAFHTNTLDALQQWRWDDGPARTTVGVTFKRAE